MKRTRKHKFRYYLSWILSVSILLSLAGAFILALPVWRLSKAQVYGTFNLSKNKIVKIADIPFGENIFFVNLEDVENRIREIIQVKNVNVHRKFPDSIIVKIEERSPFALLVIGSRTVIVDDEGYLIATQGKASYYKVSDVSRFPVIRGLKNSDLIDGKRLNLRSKIFISKSLKLLSKYIESESLQIEAGNFNNIIVFVEDVLKLEIGDSSNIEKKIEVFGAILKEIEGKWEKIEYINIKIPDLPVVKYKKY